MVPPSRTRQSPGVSGFWLKSRTSWPSKTPGRNESELIQILPSSPIERTCMRILSAWPTNITVSMSSRPGCVSSTTLAVPLKVWIPQDSCLIFSK